MAEIRVELGFLFHAGVLEELDSTEVVTSGKERAVARSVDGIDISVVKAWPDALDRPSEDTGHACPLNRLRRRGIDLLFGADAYEHELIGLTVDHQSLTILGPVKMAQSASQAYLGSCDLLQLHL